MSALPGSETRSSWKGVPLFFVTLLVLAAVRVALVFVVVPVKVAPWAGLGIAALFLAAPILALFYAAYDRWTPKLAAVFVLLGAAMQIGGYQVWAALHERGLGAVCANAVGQIGLPMWCVGLGALLATLVKDKNILIPIAIFLAMFDMFLVLTPTGITKQLVEHAPHIINAIGGQIPRVQTRAHEARINPGAFVGPADFVFLSMFFIALFRFRMRTGPTLKWMIPTLVGYMVLVLIFGLPLPALLPIGVCVLLVNRTEFKMTREEKQSTAVVAALALAILVWGATRPRPVERVVDPAPTSQPQNP